MGLYSHSSDLAGKGPKNSSGSGSVLPRFLSDGARGDAFTVPDFSMAQEVAGVIQVQHAKFAACTSAGYLAALLYYILQWQF